MVNIELTEVQALALHSFLIDELDSSSILWMSTLFRDINSQIEHALELEKSDD